MDLRSRQGWGIDGSSQWVKVSECCLVEGGGGVWAEAAQRSALVFHQSTIRFDGFLQQRAARERPRNTKEYHPSRQSYHRGYRGRRAVSCGAAIWNNRAFLES